MSDKSAVYVVNTASSRLNVRSGRSINSSILGKLTKGTQITVHEIINNWGTITYGGRLAFVQASYIEPVAPDKTAPSLPVSMSMVNALVNAPPAATYETIQGDMWDVVSYKVFGTSAFSDRIMHLNTPYIDYYVFPGGLKLRLPEIPQGEGVYNPPPWQEAVG